MRRLGPFGRTGTRLSLTQRKVLYYLRDVAPAWSTASEIADDLSMDRSAVFRSLDRLAGNLPLTQMLDRIEQHPKPRPVRWRIIQKPRPRR